MPKVSKELRDQPDAHLSHLSNPPISDRRDMDTGRTRGDVGGCYNFTLTNHHSEVLRPRTSSIDHRNLRHMTKLAERPTAHRPCTVPFSMRLVAADGRWPIQAWQAASVSDYIVLSISTTRGQLVRSVWG